MVYHDAVDFVGVVEVELYPTCSVGASGSPHICLCGRTVGGITGIGPARRGCRYHVFQHGEVEGQMAGFVIVAEPVVGTHDLYIA